MNIGLYGLPTSGKNTLIEKMIDDKLFHLPGSGTLKKLSQSLLSKNFDRTVEAEKIFLRQKFIKYARQLSYANIIVDGHYSFMDNVVYIQDDEEFYDIICYLDTPVNVVIERIQHSEKNKKFSKLSCDDLNWWRNLEIENLKKHLFMANKEFIILDNNENDLIDFFTLIKNDYFVKSYDIAGTICNNILLKCGNKDIIILTDCDKTLAKEDMTVKCFDYTDNSMNDLNHIFKDDAYSLYQFWKANKYFSMDSNLLDMDSIISNISFNTELIDDIKLSKKNNSNIFVAGLTSGVYEVWSYINNKYYICDEIYGGNFTKDSTVLISDFVKGYIAKQLKKYGKRVIAIGDSMVDIFMLLEADTGIMYAPDKVRSKLNNIQYTNQLFQLQYNLPYYNNIKIIEKIGDVI